MLISKEGFHVLTARKVGSMQLRNMHPEHMIPIEFFDIHLLGNEAIKSVERNLKDNPEAHFYILVRPPRYKFWSGIVQTVQSNHVPYLQLLTKEVCPSLGNDLVNVVKASNNNPEVNNCIIAMVQKYMHHMVLDKHCDMSYYPFVNALISNFSNYHNQITLVDIDNTTKREKQFLVKNKLLQEKKFNSVSNRVPYEWSNFSGISSLIDRHVQPFELIYQHLLQTQSHLFLSNKDLFV